MQANNPIVITSNIDNRLKYVQSRTRRWDGKFVLGFTTKPEEARVFEEPAEAQDVIDNCHNPYEREFKVDTLPSIAQSA